MRRKKWHKLRKEQYFLFEVELPTPPRVAHPKCDNDRLLNAQADLIEAVRSGLPCKKQWEALYKLALKVATKFIGKAAKKYPKVAELTAEQRQTKAHDAVAYIAEGYLSDERFCITKSYTGYIWLRVRAELFNHSKADAATDFVDIDTLANMDWQAVQDAII